MVIFLPLRHTQVFVKSRPCPRKMANEGGLDIPKTRPRWSWTGINGRGSLP